MASDVGTALSDFGGAVVDLFGAKGAGESAHSYEQASAIASQNVEISRQATQIKQTQLSREIFKSLGTTRAQVGGAGFAESGSALDILADSASQGALVKAVTAEQGAITENSYAAQAGLYAGLAKSARTASTGMTVGGVLQAAGGAISLFNAAGKIFGGSGSADAGGVLDAGITAIGDVAGSGGSGDIVAAIADIFAFA